MSAMLRILGQAFSYGLLVGAYSAVVLLLLVYLFLAPAIDQAIPPIAGFLNEEARTGITIGLFIGLMFLAPRLFE